MKTLYALLNKDAKSWWYHAQLRDRGQVEEARRRERESIRSTINSLRKCLAAPGGYMSVGRGGWTLHYGRGSSVQGYGRMDALDVQAAKLVGVPIINSLTIDDNTIYDVISLPMVAVDGNPDDPWDGDKPYGSMSYAPLEYVAAKYRELGAELHNFS